MIRKILLAVIAVTLLELAILVQLATLIGFWETLAVVFGIGALGLFLARTQGLRTLRAIQTDLAYGRMPAPRLIDQALILAGGVLFFLPGLLSDLAGIVLVIPFTRALVKRVIAARIARRLEAQYRRSTAPQGTDLSDQASYTVIIP